MGLSPDKNLTERSYRRVASAVLPALSAAALLLAIAAVAAPRPAITQAQSGKTFRLAKGGNATLRLSGRWVWTEPRVSSRAIELTPVEYFVDPGFSEWVVRARGRGTATIRSVGKPACAACKLPVHSFHVTIIVAPMIVP